MTVRRRPLLPMLIGAERRLHDLDEHQRAIANQRPFLFAVGFACLVALAVSPLVFTDALFLVGLGLTVLSRLPSTILPSARFSVLLYWLIPSLQFAAIAALRAGGGDTLVGLSLIAAFPVIWLAWFADRPLLVHTVNFTATVVIVWAPLLLDGEAITFPVLVAPLMVPVILLVIGVFAANVSRSIDAQQDDLRAKDRQLREAAERSRAHAQLLNTVIETVPVGVVVVDAEGNDVVMNSHQRRQHQLGIPQEVPDPREDQLLVFDRDKTTPIPAQDRPVRRAIDGHSFTNQLIWLGNERRRRALSVSANSIEDSSGSPAGSVIVFNDVTDLVNALEVKDDFLHSVTHELRTPLTSILGYIDLALDKAEGPVETAELTADLRVAERNAERLLHLVSDLLDTASETPVRVRSGDLADVIRSSLTSACPQAEAKDITLIDEAPPTLPGDFDPDRLHQVLDNLITNALKYSPAGGSVTAQAWAEADALFIRIKDTGHGITKHDQRQIFERFFRTPTVRESTIPGLGLGLSLTKRFVEAHHGTIEVDSAPGHGTAFTIRLPATGSMPAGAGA